MNYFVWALLLSTVLVVRAQDYVDECPEENGFFADAVQCDRYYECKNGQITDNLCADGLVFDETSIQFAKCSFPFSVDCSDRPQLQKAKSSGVCPRKNGYFPHENPEVCDQFYFCVDGVPNKITCPESLIFNPKTGQCAFSDQVDRPGCSSTEFFQFSCPNNPDSRHAHPRYPDPTDCQYFYLCLNGKDARRNGCTVGFVFNAATSSCDRQDNLEANDPCRGWYNETTLEALAPAARPPTPGGGVQLDTSDRKRVQVVRRKKPQSGAGAGVPARRQRPQARPQATAAAGPGGGRVSINPDLRAALEQEQLLRNRPAPTPRTRVRVQPPASVFGQQPEPEAADAPRGPPQFSLSNAEAIQRFRDQNRVVPESSGGGGGRLTVLSGGSSRQRPQTPQRDFTQQFEEPLTAADNDNFGDRNRFRSRRPPQFGAAPQQTQTSEAAIPQRSSGFRDRTQPPPSRGGGRNRGGASSQPTESVRDFGFTDRVRQRSRQQPTAVSRTQSQSAQISLEPQFELGNSQDNSDFANFPSFDAVRQ